MTMNSRRIGFGLVVLVIILSGTAAGAQNTTASSSSPTGITIDNDTTLLETTYNDTSGQATVVLKSETTQVVTITDAGQRSSGELTRRTVVADAGERTTITLEATKTQGYVGVTISTEKTLYLHVIRKPQGAPSPNPWGNTTSTAGWIGGVSVSVLMIGLAAVRMKRKDPTEPEDIE